MKKSEKIILIVLCSIILLVGIYFIFRNNTKNIKTTDILKNASMIIKEGTLTNTGCTVIITDTEKEEKHTYGESFSIEIKKDNKWQKLKPIIEDYAFNLIGYSVDENNELQQDINWEGLYGKLEPGEYRLVKDAAINYKDSYLGSGVIYAEFTINAEEVKLGLITNALTNTISINNDEAQFILNLFNKYKYTTETCDGTDKYNLIIDENIYGIEVYGYGMDQYDAEIHITTTGKEIVLNEEDSLKLLKIINTYVPDNYKPIVDCLKSQLGAYIADQSLEFKEKDITSLLNIDKSKLDYSYLKTNEHGGFYLIVKASNNILKEVKDELESKYQKLNYKSYEGYDLYVYNNNDLIIDDEVFEVCQFD